MSTILVLEDDPRLNRVVCAHLNAHGHRALAALTAMEAFDHLAGNLVDLIVSDIMMPDTDGFAFAERVRADNPHIPLMFVTARDDISAKQKGYRAGIDDYMVKPVDLEELELRIGALLRRAHIATEKKLAIGGLVMDGDEMTVTVDGADVPLTVKEFHVLFKLLSYPKKTFTRNQLMDEFWGLDNVSGPRTVDVYITKLRDKLAACKDIEIVTVHGLGYKGVIREA
jgi:DNA-binding response OmpR family regulator